MLCRSGDGRTAMHVDTFLVRRKTGSLGPTMEVSPPSSVVILYQHPLLGEGLAKYIQTQTGVMPTIASGTDLDAVWAALAIGPLVVIFERTESLRGIDLRELAPKAILIDISRAALPGSAIPKCQTGLERIVQVVRNGAGLLARSAEGEDRAPASGPSDR